MAKPIDTQFDHGSSDGAISRIGQGTIQSRLDSINLGFKEKEISERAKQMGVGYINLLMVPINPDALRIISPKEAELARAVPFFLIGKEVKLASPSIESQEYKDLYSVLTARGLHVSPVLISEESLAQGLSLYNLHKIVEKEIRTYAYDDEALKQYEKELADLVALKDKFEYISDEDAVDGIIFGALKMGASDIHMQPESKEVSMRFRIDGVLHTIFTFPISVYGKILIRMKFRSALKMNVILVPQDGKFAFQLSDREIDIRMSTLPTEFGETVVLRLLDAKKGIVPFKDLGFIGITHHHLELAIGARNGMILVTGPTGSGKTTTLYSILNTISTPKIKVITLEDPVEYHLPNISQSQIHEDEGYTFGSGLRSILRQDPDVIMVGEIRDLETAETAVQAALTGHVMLSTVHTNSAVETIPRLLNMGVKPFLLAPSLNAIVAQRLVRMLCPHCRKALAVNQEEEEIFQKVIDDIRKVYKDFKIDVPTSIYHPEGCTLCTGTGYVGQIAIIEVLNMSDAIRDLILTEASTKQILEKTKEEGMITMKQDGLLKVMQGMTTLEEVMRVAGA
ncbi:MAG: GspE/PulE family protein [Candidatus Gracilibacteria bacterium]